MSDKGQGQSHPQHTANRDTSGASASASSPGHRDDAEREHRALLERARQLGATAEELEAELEALALQAEAVLHRLRGGNVH